MRRMFLYLLGAAFLVNVCMASAATCPAYVKRLNITTYLDSGYVLPVKGTVVTAATYGNGLYKADLGTITPTLIPNTNTGNCNSTQITEDGQWILFNQGGPNIIRIDGQFKTKVPVTSSGSEGCCTFWWNAPSGKLEIVYRATDSDVHSIPVTLSANAAPTFGTDREIINAGGTIQFSMGCAANHFFTRINAAGYDGPKMVTIPATGVATTADFWTPSSDPVIGCKCTMSHDGRLCCYNPGYDQLQCCLADEFYLLRHKSFALLPFQEKTAPSVGWDAGMLGQMAASINWCPKKYLFLSATDSCKGASAGTSNFWSDFKGWCYTNDTNYIVGDLSSLPYNGGGKDSSAHANNPDSGTIWLVHYPTNTWTCILKPPAPVSRTTLLAFPSVWIDTSYKTGTITPQHGNRLQYRGIPLEGISYYYDIRGRRIVVNARTTQKLYSGVYYTVSPDGVMKRIVIGK
ncbi:MAG TPA: hypothetical protein VLX68_05875 [Chitinivibrionales bacterium]|nr:hypothetical protein [Chitinivibrionales bacterium]